VFGSHLLYSAWIIALMIAVVAAIVLLIVRLTAPAPYAYPPPPAGPQPPARETPLDILARRFASGELSAEEYQKARDLLQGGSSPPPS
jgi:uncharacterized membrane protein